MSKKDILGEIMKKLVTISDDLLGIVDDFLAKLSDPKWVKAAKKFLRKEEAWAKMARCYELTVNYGKSVEQAVMDGKYDKSDDYINSQHFTEEHPGKSRVEKLEMELVHFGYKIDTPQARSELDNRGLMPANLHEILAFGAKYPGVQREVEIAALNAECKHDARGDTGCICLSGGDDNRIVWLVRSDDEVLHHATTWAEHFHFAAVRKQSAVD